MDKTILIVEDEQSQVKILRESLENEGFKVLVERNSQDGLKTALMKRPNLILLDLIMPELSGIEMLEELRKDGWGRDVPVIILSNQSDTAEVHNAVTFGVAEFLVKADHSIEEIISLIKSKIK